MLHKLTFLGVFFYEIYQDYHEVFNLNMPGIGYILNYAILSIDLFKNYAHIIHIYTSDK